ncbi:adenosylcobinamide-GDP ribazoletransferase [Phycobium rhodophyticola]
MVLALVGLALAGLATLLALSAQAIGIKPEIAALLALALMVIQTGALHEDGLADVADGFWGGTTPARRLEIMKDSAIGSYGTLALILSLGLRGAALVALADHLAVALFTAAALSRAAMPAVMCALPNARSNGLSAHTGRPSAATLLIALAIATLATILLTGWSALWLLPIAALTTLACAKIAQAKIGGQTGDTLGATQQITEIATLLALSALL